MKLAKAELFNYTNLIFVSIIQEAESICMGHDNSAPLVEEIPVKREKVSESILETATCLNLIVLGPGWICHVQYNPKLSGFESFLSSLLNEMTWSKCLGWNKADSWPTFFEKCERFGSYDTLPDELLVANMVLFRVWWESRRRVKSQSVSSGVHCAMASWKCSKPWCSMWPEKLSNCMMIKWFQS